jgi:DnaK suppressor protein
MQLNSRDLEYIKNILLQRLSDISRNTESAIKKFSESSDKYPDPVDMAYFDSERWITINTLNREGMHSSKIHNSLRKIEKGDYGICEQCGHQISFERLKARPFTSYCIGCKAEMEKEEKLTTS